MNGLLALRSPRTKDAGLQLRMTQWLCQYDTCKVVDPHDDVLEDTIFERGHLQTLKWVLADNADGYDIHCFVPPRNLYMLHPLAENGLLSSWTDPGWWESMNEFEAIQFLWDTFPGMRGNAYWWNDDTLRCIVNK